MNILSQEQYNRVVNMTASLLAWFPYLGIEQPSAQTIQQIQLGMSYQVMNLHEQIGVLNGLDRMVNQ